MKRILLSLLVPAVSAISLLSLGTEFNSHTTFDEWEEFKHTHGKTYDSQEDENLRFFIYRANKRLVDDHNDGYRRGEHSFILEVNQFADLLASEFADLRHGFIGRRPGLEESEVAATFLRLPEDVSLPESVDWRARGAVTAVQDQGNCGSCWAFSSTGALEGQHFRKTGQLIKLSEQNLIDCATPFGSEGCEGGRMRAAFRYVREQGGVDTGAAYPYQGHDHDRCRFSENDIGATDVGHVGIPEGDEEALKEALAVHGPIAIAIDASKPSFQFYSSGVYDESECSDSRPNHAMLAVGYGTDELGKDFWLVKNSWSVGWGEDGYVRIARDHNTCGIASSGVFPLV